MTTLGATPSTTTFPATAADVGAEAAGATAAHEADTTSVHGIANTANLYAAGGTDVAVADGGTGASTAADARTNLGLGAAALLPSPFLPYRTGGTFYYAPLHGVETALALTAGTLYAMPFFVPVTTTFAGIGVVASGITGSAACRLGIFSDTGGVPDALVVDAGQVATDTAGFKSIAISQALTAGWYWLACAMQGANGLLFSAPSGSGVTFVPTTAPGSGLISGYAVTGVTAGLPSPWGATKTQTARCPVVFMAPA